MTSSRVLIALAGGLVLMLGWTSVVGDRGVLRIRELRETEAQMRAKAEALEAANAQLRENVRRLNEDDRYIERVARESQGLVRDGETVYRFAGE